MNRYIDKEQIYTAIDIVRNYCIDNGRCFEVMILEMVMHEISKIPTADVVAVVRCRDCTHYDRASGTCNHFGYYTYSPDVDENDYCSCGERREE